MPDTFFAADPHFNDDNIIRYERPQFKSVVEMNNWIIDGWKRVVGDKDKIIIVGDVGREDPSSTQSLQEIIDSLPGEKHLVIGNHDEERSIGYWMSLFDFVYPYPIIYEKFYLVSHDTMYLNPQMPYANIHGHIHGNKMISSGAINQYINVSWEWLPNGEPINFEDIKALFKKKEGRI